jgi:hypothetical protein
MAYDGLREICKPFPSAIVSGRVVLLRADYGFWLKSRLDAERPIIDAKQFTEECGSGYLSDLFFVRP